MNGVLALCHFCEVFRGEVKLEDFVLGNIPTDNESYYQPQDDSDTLASSTRSSELQLHTRTSSETLSPAASPLRPPRSLSASATPSSAAPSPSAASSSRTCPGCSWLSPVPGFVTNDHDSHASFASTHVPRQAELYSTVRTACVRSLSCEVCPGREGPLLFGDAKNGYVFSYSFSLRDHQARGFQRQYSFVCVMADRVHLIGCWSFLRRHVGTLVRELQQKALAADRAAVEAASTPPSAPPPSSAVPTSATSAPASAQATPPSRVSADELLSRGFTSRLMRHQPSHFGGRSRRSRQLRSLPELTGQPDIFWDLHCFFTWLLKSATSRLLERQIEGPSLIAPPPVPEPLPESLRPVPIREDDCASITSFAPLQDASRPQSLQTGGDAVLAPATSASMPRNPGAMAGSAGGSVGGAAAADADDMAAQLLARLDEEPADELVFTSLRHLHSCLEATHFALIVYNLVVGNQVIVRGEQMMTATSILNVLSTMLPANCCHMLVNQFEYREVYECNLLGLYPEAVIPDHIKRSAFILIDLTVTDINLNDTFDGSASESSDREGSDVEEVGEEEGQRAQQEPASEAQANGNGGAADVTKPRDTGPSLLFVIHAAESQLAEVDCTLVRQICHCFVEPHGEAVDEQWLSVIREEWMRYAKAFFKFSRSTDKPPTDSMVARLLRGLSLRPADLPIIKFWCTALSRAHRLKLLKNDDKGPEM